MIVAEAKTERRERVRTVDEEDARRELCDAVARRSQVGVTAARSVADFGASVGRSRFGRRNRFAGAGGEGEGEKHEEGGAKAHISRRSMPHAVGECERNERF
mgnify:CR=1 FL=1